MSFSPHQRNRLREEFTVTRGDLRWDGHDLVELARHHGTPLYVVNRQTLEDSYQGFLDAFRASRLAVGVYFSVKTNPSQFVVRTLADAGAGVEVVSDYEFWLARNLGLSGDRIIVSGPVKTSALLERAVGEGSELINTESVDELCAIAKIASKWKRRQGIGVRINPSLPRQRFSTTVSAGNAASPFGFELHSHAWRSALALIKSSPELDLRGLQCHIGSGIRSVAPYRKTLKRMESVWKDLWRLGFRPQTLDIGGGFNVATLKELSLLGALRLFGLGGQPRGPRTRSFRQLQDVAAECSRTVTRLAAVCGSSPQIIVEPGRALCAQAQVLLLRVQRIKQSRSSSYYAFCDGGALSLSPMLLGEHHDVVIANRATEPPKYLYTLVGNMPTPLDIVATKRKLPPLQPGDIVAVLDAGAYFGPLGNTFAGPRPATVAIDGSCTRLICRRERYGDLLSREENPSASGGLSTELGVAFHE